MGTCLVAGGAGFIGSHLCEKLLEKDYKVICIDNLITSRQENINYLKTNPNFLFIKYDVIKPLSEDLKADFVFHLASPASPNHYSKISYHSLPLETMLVNTTGTFNLLEFCQKNNAKFLFASTSEVYGVPKEHPQKEEYRGNVSTTGPRSVYDEAKRFGETITAYFWRSRGVDGRIARIFNTYGPRMMIEDKRMIIEFIVAALKNQDINIFGDGKNTRSLCYVDDTVEGLMRLMFSEGTKSQIVNIGSTDEHTVLEYAEMIVKLVNSKSKIAFGEPLPEDDPIQRKPDISKAKNLLGWQPMIGLEEGLAKTIDYFRKTI